MKRTIATVVLAMTALSAAAAGAAHAATTISVSRSVTIGAAPDVVWSTVCDYDAPSVWDPLITSTTLTHGDNNQPGAKRQMTTDDGGTIDDTLMAWNAARRVFATRMGRTALPVRHYRDRVAVTPSNDGSRLTWTADFQPARRSTPAHARRAVTQRIERALAQVRTMLGAPDSDTARSRTKAGLSSAHS